MKTYNFLILGLILISISSCSKDNDTQTNENYYLVFGHFYGECMGEECVETFKLTNTKLYEDRNDIYGSTDFNFDELGSDKFDQVKDLIFSVPDQLLNENDSTFGCPDCLDQGGLLIQYSKNGNLKTWRIDQIKDAVPSYLHDFMDEVNEKIALINN